MITTIAGTCYHSYSLPDWFGPFSGDGGPATSAGFNHPWGIFQSSVGDLYIADQQNFRIRRISGSNSKKIRGQITSQ
jgi:hypothetical protein